MALGNGSNIKTSLPGVRKVQGVWTGGGAAANCTKASGDLSQGISSVAYNAATGKYKITFTDVGQQIVGGSVEVMRAIATTTPMVANIGRATFSRSAKTVEFYVTQLSAATNPLTDLLTTDKVCINIEFGSVGPNS